MKNCYLHGLRNLVSRCSLLAVVVVLAASVLSAEAGPAETLYQKLRTVGLDRSRVYRIREASLDRAPLHVTLTDGTIAFTEDVLGRVTGAFFEGDGEILFIPPNQVERSSMSRFTGAAILEEKFATVYLRFNDDTFKELQPFLTPREDSGEFITRWGDGARDLAEPDALRLLVSFSRLLPSDNHDPPQTAVNVLAPTDRMLHMRVQGLKLGAFDVFFDLAATEQISAGQMRNVGGKSYYDVWASFAIGKAQTTEGVAEIAGEEQNYGDIEVSSYKINAEINPPTELNGEARLKMLVRRSGERTVLFELSRYLNVRQVEADGHAIEFIHNQALQGSQLARRGDDLVAVVFPAQLQAAQTMELRFSYGGSVLSEAGNGLLYVGARGTWYPNRGFAKALFDMEFRYPNGWTLVATGKRQEAVPQKIGSTNASSTHISRWVSERTIPVAGFNLGKYSRVSKHVGTTAVEVYAASGMERNFPQMAQEEVLQRPPFFPLGRPVAPALASLPPSPAGNAELVADATARAIAFFARRFGPYPYGELDVTQMPGTLSQGWPGLIFLSSFSFLSPDQKSALHMSSLEKTMSDAVIGHETAHQWWGDLVTWRGYRDQWIVEGLANYCSLLLLESENPSQFRTLMARYRDDLLQKNKDGIPLMDAGPVTLGTRLSSSQFPDGYETIAYERGTWLFHMLRTMMRGAEETSGTHGRAKGGTPDEPFLRALHTLRDRDQARPISTLDMIHALEEQLPAGFGPGGRKSLDWFYENWVNGTAIPELELHSLKYASKANSVTVSGVVRQKDAPESLVTSVAIYASVAGRNIFLGRVFADGPETQFHMTAPAGTHKVVLDPNQTVLSRPH